MAYGAALVDDDADRIGERNALRLDEALFVRDAVRRSPRWSTSIVDVSAGRLLGVVPGRRSVEPSRWLASVSTLAGLHRVGDVGSSGPYPAVFDAIHPDAVQV